MSGCHKFSAYIFLLALSILNVFIYFNIIKIYFYIIFKLIVLYLINLISKHLELHVRSESGTF